MRPRTVAAVFTLAVLAGTTGALAAPVRGDDLIACRNKGQITRHGDWLEIKAPPVVTGSEGARTIVDYAAPPGTPKLLYATNGDVIKNSVDGGCEWQTMPTGIDAPQAGPQAPDAQPAKPDVFTHLLAPNGDSVWAAGYDDVSGTPKPHVYLWQGLDTDAPEQSRVENGLPQVGRPVELAGTVAGGVSIYLLVEEPPDPTTGSLEWTRRLYVTVVPNDPQQLALVGTIWQNVPLPADFGRVEGMAISPGGGQVWLWSASQYATTADPRADQVSWDVAPSPGGTITAIDVNTRGEALVAAQGGAVLVSADFTVIGRPKLPVVPVSMTHGTLSDIRVLSGDKGTWGYDHGARRWVDITPQGVGALRNLAMGAGVLERIVLGNTNDAIYRYDTYPGESFIPSDDDLLGRDWPDDGPTGSNKLSLTIDPEVVTVAPGEIKTADVTFTHPSTITPLDVFFIVDTTGSMDTPIADLRKSIYGIAARLKSQLHDNVCFGVGDVRDYSPAPTEAGKVYRTHQKITCEDDPKLPAMSAALAQMSAAGGGGEPEEAQTIALTQMIKGDGSTQPLVLPDQDAEFRREAYKVAVLITDSFFKQGQAAGGYYPTIDETAELLKANGVKVVSVLTITDINPDKPFADMTELAEKTDSYAPPTGVDCDGDGTLGQYDIRPNAPLVCVTPGSDPNLLPLITSLVRGVPDPGTVAFDVTDEYDVIREPIVGPLSALMNLKEPILVRLGVPVSCTPEQDGLDMPVTFVPTVRALPVHLTGGSILSGTLTVQCRAIPGVPPRIPDPPDPPEFEKRVPKHVLAAALLPPGNPPVQPPGNLNLNAGLSQEEEQQFQLAAVTQGAQDAADEESIELAMTGLERRERETPATLFVAGAMAIAAGAALATRYSRRTSASIQRRHS